MKPPTYVVIGSAHLCKRMQVRLSGDCTKAFNRLSPVTKSTCMYRVPCTYARCILHHVELSTPQLDRRIFGSTTRSKPWIFSLPWRATLLHGRL